MTGNSDHDFAVGWSRAILRICGAWPNPNVRNETGTTCLSLLTAFNMLVFICIPQTINLFKIWPDIFLISENVSTSNLTVLSAVIKLFVMFNKKEVLKQLVALIYDDWNVKKSDVEWKMMRVNAEISRKISLYCFSATMGTLIFYYLEQLILNIQGFYGFRRGFFQYCISFDSVKISIFALVCFMQATAGALAGMMCTGVISFLGTVVLHLYGQYTILQLSVENLINNHEFKELNEFQLKLKFIVERHVLLNRCAAHVENTFSTVFLLEIISCSIQLCLVIFIALQAINSSGGMSALELLFLFLYIMFFLSNLYVICYVGEKLQLVGSKMGDSLYNSEWYKLNTQEMKHVITLFQGTKIPLKITAGNFCVFSIQTFAEVIKKSVGYLSVLVTVNQNINQ